MKRDVSISTGNEVLKALGKLNFVQNKILVKGNFKDYLDQFKKNDLILMHYMVERVRMEVFKQWMEKNNIKYAGSGPTSSALCMNKAKSKDFAELLGIQTPKWQIINDFKLRDLIRTSHCN